MWNQARAREGLAGKSFTNMHRLKLTGYAFGNPCGNPCCASCAS